MTADMGYFSTSPSQSLQFPNQTHTTPNTPSSIPDIILTGNNLYYKYSLHRLRILIEFI